MKDSEIPPSLWMVLPGTFDSLWWDRRFHPTQSFTSSQKTQSPYSDVWHTEHHPGRGRVQCFRAIPFCTCVFPNMEQVAGTSLSHHCAASWGVTSNFGTLKTPFLLWINALHKHQLQQHTLRSMLTEIPACNPSNLCYPDLTKNGHIMKTACLPTLIQV